MQSTPLTTTAELRFGCYPLPWGLESNTPPTPCAVNVETHAIIRAEGSILALPDEEAPTAVIYGSEVASQWLLEQGDDAREVADLEVVSIGGQLWRLHLPQHLEPTVERSADSAPHLAELSLHFEVSADEEHVTLTATTASDEHPLGFGSRAHHYTLLTLARARIDDAALPPASQGWVYQDVLLAMLRLDRARLNLNVYRARRQFAMMHIQNANGLIERRESTRQLRLGVGKLQIRKAGSDSLAPEPSAEVHRATPASPSPGEADSRTPTPACSSARKDGSGHSLPSEFSIIHPTI